MTHTERHIVETYSGLFESLSAVSKLELLERLAKSIRQGKKSREKDFLNHLEHLPLINQPKKLLRKSGIKAKSCGAGYIKVIFCHSQRVCDILKTGY